MNDINCLLLKVTNNEKLNLIIIASVNHELEIASELIFLFYKIFSPEYLKFVSATFISKSPICLL